MKVASKGSVEAVDDDQRHALRVHSTVNRQPSFARAECPATV